MLLSHPAWVCGLKHHCNTIVCNSTAVTPRVGVRIETTYNTFVFLSYSVTPRVGVRIETIRRGRKGPYLRVTPRVGVRIETSSKSSLITSHKGHTPRGCAD